MFNFNIDQKTIFAAGLVTVGLYLFYKHEATSAVTSATNFITDGTMGESVFDDTHDPTTNEPTPIGRILDWLAGIEYGVDY